MDKTQLIERGFNILSIVSLTLNYTKTLHIMVYFSTLFPPCAVLDAVGSKTTKRPNMEYDNCGQKIEHLQRGWLKGGGDMVFGFRLKLFIFSSSINMLLLACTYTG